MKQHKINVQFIKSDLSAKIPTQNDGDVGFDLYSVEAVNIEPGKRAAVNTGLKLASNVQRLFVYDYSLHDPQIVGAAVPFFKIEGRSGLALKSGVFPIGGIVDPSYRGEIKVILYNSDDKTFEVNVGDKIAQMVCYLTYANSNPVLVELTEVKEMVETQRGDKGFGSSGVR